MPNRIDCVTNINDDEEEMIRMNVCLGNLPDVCSRRRDVNPYVCEQVCVFLWGGI